MSAESKFFAKFSAQLRAFLRTGGDPCDTFLIEKVRKRKGDESASMPFDLVRIRNEDGETTWWTKRFDNVFGVPSGGRPDLDKIFEGAKVVRIGTRLVDEKGGDA
jgi:hypothetical protein